MRPYIDCFSVVVLVADAVVTIVAAAVPMTTDLRV